MFEIPLFLEDAHPEARTQVGVVVVERVGNDLQMNGTARFFEGFEDLRDQLGTTLDLTAGFGPKGTTFVLRERTGG